jgi:hypothetical protein
MDFELVLRPTLRGLVSMRSCSDDIDISNTIHTIDAIDTIHTIHTIDVDTTIVDTTVVIV